MVIVFSIPTILIVILVIRGLVSFKQEDPEGFKTFVRFLVGAFLVFATAIISLAGYFDPAVWDLVLEGIAFVGGTAIVPALIYLAYKVIKFFVTKK